MIVANAGVDYEGKGLRCSRGDNHKGGIAFLTIKYDLIIKHTKK